MNKVMSARAVWLRAAGLVAVAFGVLTVKEGGAVLFGDNAARTAAGHYVPFVLWFNFLAGFAYVGSGVGLLLRRRWGAWLALAILAGTGLVFAGFASPYPGRPRLRNAHHGGDDPAQRRCGR